MALVILTYNGSANVFSKHLSIALTDTQGDEENDIGDHLSENILQVHLSAAVPLLQETCAPQN